MQNPRAIPGDGLLHPVAIFAIAVLVFNDHWLKRHSPGFVSGKLSDLAGLVFFPLALQAAHELLLRRWSEPFTPSFTIALVSTVMTSVVFTLTQVWTPAALAFTWGLGVAQWPFHALFTTSLPPLVPVAHVADAEDLLAIPAVLIALTLAHRRAHAWKAT